MDNNFSSPEIYKKDQSIIEKTLGSVKELLTKQAEEKIKEYLKKNNIEEYNNESYRKSNQHNESISK
tara:strand:+ start:697 stop:897 length:201 start_codon:yes stop_codon:yes gene_type:complete